MAHDIIREQCREDELNKLRLGDKWPGQPAWTEAEATLKREWEERHAKEIAEQDPTHTILTNYFKKVDLGLSHLPQAATQLVSSARKNAPGAVQAASASMARFDATAALKKVQVKPGKVPIGV